ncbi:MAG: DUF348 domain-containing protein, partial [Chloroflexi bacterium]|nr:DUF348 domain-containing protein [Chloroflexota bacterium]
SAGYSLAPEDFVQPGSDSPLRGVDRIIYRPAILVTVQSPGGLQTVLSAALAPADILAAAGVRTYPADRLWADGVPVADPSLALDRTPSRLRLARGRAMPLSIQGGTVLLTSSASTLGEALLEAGYQLQQGDSVAPGLDAAFIGLASADYRAARAIRIGVDGTTVEARVAGPTVGEALAQAGVPLAGLDRSEPGAAEMLPQDGRVRIIRVREDVLIDQIPVKAPTQQEFSAEHDLDTQTLLDPGAYGVQAKRTRVRYEDGVELSRQAEGEWLAVEPKPRVVAYGTRIVLKTLDTEFGPIQYYRAIPVYATSYSPCRSGADRCYPGTSSGKPVQRGVIAVRYAWYLALGFGVPVYIPGYGIATIEDIGGGFPDRHWIDLGYSDEDWELWSSYTTLYFIAPVPPDVPVIFP